MVRGTFIYNEIQQFPHCDARVLHAPGQCKFCDGHPDWQALRIAWGVCFTGEKAETTEPSWRRDRLVPCPSEVARPLETIELWGGNRASIPSADGVAGPSWPTASDVPPVNRSAQVLTSGEPVPADRSHTELKANLQQRDYVVLTAEERAKGFVRPVRTKYVHVGKLVKFTNPDHPSYSHFGIELDCGEHRLGGCGTQTTMALAIAETYARDPGFYSGTFCVGCGKHLPLDEFVWEGTDEQVGS